MKAEGRSDQLFGLGGSRVLVTGGAGFVGSGVAKRLAREGASVVILDDFFTGLDENLDGAKLEVVRGSVTDFELVRTAMDG